MSNTTDNRSKNSFLAVIVAVILGFYAFVDSFHLLSWNEGRSIAVYKKLQEGQKSFIAISSNPIDPKNDGKLVYLNGPIATQETLVDPIFNISQNTIKLKRVVKMYQWTEEEHEHKNSASTYTYSKVWDEEPIQSSGFHDPNNHKNPSVWTYTSNRFVAKKVTLGDFRLSTAQIDRLENYIPLKVDDTHLNDVMKKSVLVRDGTYYIGEDPQSPTVGDLQIAFLIVPPSDISIVSEQTKDSFEAYPLKNPFVFSNDKKPPFSLVIANFAFGLMDSLRNVILSKSGSSLHIDHPEEHNSTATDTTMDTKKIDLFEVGSYTANEMFERAYEMNDSQTWRLRVAGYFIMFIGLGFMLTPIKLMLGFIPIFGTITNMIISIFSALVTFLLSLITILFAWTRYHPMIAWPLLGLCLVVLLILIVSHMKIVARKHAQLKIAVGNTDTQKTDPLPIDSPSSNNMVKTIQKNGIPIQKTRRFYLFKILLSLVLLVIFMPELSQQLSGTIKEILSKLGIIKHSF